MAKKIYDFYVNIKKANKTLINLQSDITSPLSSVLCVSFVVEILQNQLVIWRPVSSVRANVSGQYNTGTDKCLPAQYIYTCIFSILQHKTNIIYSFTYTFHGRTMFIFERHVKICLKNTPQSGNELGPLTSQSGNDLNLLLE